MVAITNRFFLRQLKLEQFINMANRNTHTLTPAWIHVKQFTIFLFSVIFTKGLPF